MKLRIALHARAERGEPLDCVSVGPTTIEDKDRKLRRLYDVVKGLGLDTVPLTMAVLQQHAREIGERQGMLVIAVSPGYLRP